MNQSPAQTLYFYLPVRLQEAALSLYARHLDRLYYGPVFESALAETRSRQFASPEAVRVFQAERLAAIVAFARRQVPYYRSAFAALPTVRSIDDLPLLPTLDKQRLRQHEGEFLADAADPKKLILDRTSGSTGTSLKVYWDRESRQRFWAANEVRVREAVGVSRHLPRAMMGGRPVVRGDARRPPFWRYVRYWKQLYLSSYHVSRRWAAGYVEAIRTSGVQWLTGYGSAIAALAEHALDLGLEPVAMRAVVVSGDTLQAGMRRSIEAFFGTCRDQYGQAEGVCWLMECDCGRLHLSPEFGVLEILDEGGEPCGPGETGELVVTGLLNHAMPLIRYRTGDMGAWDADQACPCGQPFPVVKNLCGRVDDYLVTADGSTIGRLSTAVKGSPSIHSLQIVQDRPGHAFLLVRPGEGYRGADADVIRQDIVSRIGAFALDVVEAAEIPKSPVGKTRLVVRLPDRGDWPEQYRFLAGRRPWAPVNGR